ncbi:ATP-binding cassette sub-family C member 9-like isoform X2 [Acanthaster planci]|uniref:ATP-binding cassette sub-family C member 9-like isoform X2 n=1 Tax=Acanthaster planci TaxID=133434 RepID=A0A8B7Y151_ACAPL|nr:ATP-binding cassette sub-family C member 9-like isoform X2 [Acanthaster planci]
MLRKKQILINIVLLYLLLGFSALIGAASLFLMMPLTTLAGRGISKFQKKALLFSDSRLKYCKELLVAMRLVKMYGWEDVFRQTIESVRKQELLANLFRYVFFAVSTTIASGGPVLITLISFGTYTLLSGEALTPEVALPALSLFFILENSLFYFPFYISYMVTGVVSTHRLQAFLMSAEVEGSSNRTSHTSSNDAHNHDLEVSFKPVMNSSLSGNDGEPPSRSNGSSDGLELQTLHQDKNSDPDSECLPSGTAVKIECGNFSWNSGSEAVLHDISVTIPRGKLTVIIGCVGSGKSALLSAILGEMTTLSGHVHLADSDVAYTAQKPWIINASVRDNITLGCDMDDARYQEVIKACALQTDLEQFPAGDQTEIGEKGINISGGQKQRISLARALYSDKTTVIMDDPLSALDAHVCRHVVQQGIVGLLSNEERTAILVTNHLFLTELADHVIVMVNGRVELQGTPDEIGAEEYHGSRSWPQLLQQTSDRPDQADALVWSPEDEPLAVDQSNSTTNDKKQNTSSHEKMAPSGRLVKEEERKYGSVSYRVYLYLIRVTGWPLLAWIVGLFVFNSCVVGRAFKLAEWSEAGVTNANASAETDYYIMSYAALSGACVTVYTISDVARTVAAYYGTRNLFKNLLNNVTHLPLRFFDTTPTGRILNRFSSDTNSIDQYLFQNLDAVLFNIVEGLFILILDSIVAPAYLIAAVPLAVVNFLLVRFFLASSREIKRLDSISRSPILAYFTQTLDGLPTIRAYGYQKHFLGSFLSKVNENCTAYLYLQTSNLWLNIRLDILAAFMVPAAGLAALLALSFGNLSTSLVGLAIAIASRGSALLSYIARFYGELEIRMNAVERIEHYTCLPTEKYHGIVPADNWPASGGIQFNHVSARYDITLQPVLNQIDLQIEPGQKIGICGRTGSGKSSLTLALLQLIDTHEGSLVIDGMDVSRVSLSVLRQRLSIIPQDPVLFTGTIRKNLDPTGRMADSELWEALQIAQVKGLVSDLGGLDFQVSEGGENFSVGQRQLFCLARAFLRKSRILIMDEATASVDVEMDKTLQEVVAEAFKDRTVLTVAHRVETIMNCDTILVMSNGEIVETGPPPQLLAMPGGEFAALVQASSSRVR